MELKEVAMYTLVSSKGTMKEKQRLLIIIAYPLNSL